MYFPYYYGYGYGIDKTYSYLILFCFALSLLASLNVKLTFREYAGQFSYRNITGAEAARRVLAAHNIHGVRVEQVGGSLTDHFDPKSAVIRLSQDVYNSTSTSAIGVACHEAGHAVQCVQGYSLFRLWLAVLPLAHFGSQLAMPLIFLGLLFLSFSSTFLGDAMITLGVICFSLSFLVNLVTLPLEFNASHRAMKAIADSDLLTEEEQVGARKTLRAAALTYVASTALSLLQLLRFAAIFGARRRND